MQNKENNAVSKAMREKAELLNYKIAQMGCLD